MGADPFQMYGVYLPAAPSPVQMLMTVHIAKLENCGYTESKLPVSTVLQGITVDKLLRRRAQIWTVEVVASTYTSCVELATAPVDPGIVTHVGAGAAAGAGA